MIALQSGIQLSISDFKLSSATMIEYGDFPTVFGFGFCLAGDISNHPDGFKDADPIRAGQSAAFHFDSRNMRETVGTRRVVRLNIMMEPQAFHALLERDEDGAFSALHRLKHRPQRVFGTLTPAMRCSLMQIMDCPYQGLTRAYFLESKVLELMACKLDQLESEQSRTGNRTGLRAEDIDRARYAGELMTRSLENPPGIAELASQVGMCQSRLYRCFKEVYGVTPFEYLRHKRLETARRLLDRNEMNVTHVAYTVGYSSLSHFTKAFKQHTGYLPGRRGKNRSVG
jgi:AraC-like DNA-binding protein